jgi:hypothetical protein
MRQINTENKVDALILSRRASQNQNSQNTATLKALHEFMHFGLRSAWGYEKYRCTKIT